MQTITKTYNIYEFGELSQDIQQKVIEKEANNIREAEIEYFLGDEMEWLAMQLIEEKFEEKAVFQGVYYSLSYCQGDGAMIEFDLKYCNKNVKIRHDGGHYYHENSFYILEECGEELTEKQYKQLHKKIYNINKQLVKYGYEFIEQDRTEQAIEQLKDCMFYENGDIY